MYIKPCFWEIHLVITHSSGSPHLRGSTQPLTFYIPTPFTPYILHLHTPLTLYILHIHSLLYSPRGSNIQHFSPWWRSSLSSSAVTICGDDLHHLNNISDAGTPDCPTSLVTLSLPRDRSTPSIARTVPGLLKIQKYQQKISSRWPPMYSDKKISIASGPKQ